MRVYLANKMTGIPRFNYPWFYEAADVLRGLGHEVVSPAEIDTPEEQHAFYESPDGLGWPGEARSWGEILAGDVKLIADGGIDAIVVGPEWADSQGARLETFVATQLGLPVLRYPDLQQLESFDLTKGWAKALAKVPVHVA